MRAHAHRLPALEEAEPTSASQRWLGNGRGGHPHGGRDPLCDRLQQPVGHALQQAAPGRGCPPVRSVCTTLHGLHEFIARWLNANAYLEGFDPDIGQESLGLSVNKAILLPRDGEASIVSPPSDSYQEQLRCLTTLEEQISSWHLALAKQNITNTAAESKRLDQLIVTMSIISQDLERAVGDILRIAGKYVGKEPPKVTIPKDYEAGFSMATKSLRCCSSRCRTRFRNPRCFASSKRVKLSTYVDVDDEILRTKDEMDADLENELGKHKLSKSWSWRRLRRTRAA